MHLADELARTLDDGDQMRVLPIISHGAASDVEDLLYLHGVDITFTQSDAPEYFRTRRRTPNLANRIQYIARLPVAELHVAARGDVHTLEDLRGRKVAFDPEDASAMTGPIVFERLGIPVKARFAVFLNQPEDDRVGRDRRFPRGGIQTDRVVVEDTAGRRP